MILVDPHPDSRSVSKVGMVGEEKHRGEYHLDAEPERDLGGECCISDDEKNVPELGPRESHGGGLNGTQCD
jgi:hypothetical protein